MTTLYDSNSSAGNGFGNAPTSTNGQYPPANAGNGSSSGAGEGGAGRAGDRSSLLISRRLTAASMNNRNTNRYSVTALYSMAAEQDVEVEDDLARGESPSFVPCVRSYVSLFPHAATKSRFFFSFFLCSCDEQLKSDCESSRVGFPLNQRKTLYSRGTFDIWTAALLF